MASGVRYSQALPLWQEIGDRAGEAVTLHNLGELHTWLGEKEKALDSYSLRPSHS